MNINGNQANKHKSKLDTWASVICAGREGGCESCGIRNVRFDAAHIVRRNILATRWLQGNLLKLCRTCHRAYEDDPVMFQSFVLELLGEHQMDILHTLKEFIWPDLKYTVGEVKQIGELDLGDVLTMYRTRRGR